MDSELQPRCAVALLPFAVLAQPVNARQADLCRGFASFLEQRFGQLPGVHPQLQHLFVSSEDDPDRKGWLMTNSLWPLEQALAMPLPNRERLTHLLQGEALWQEDMARVTLELIDFQEGTSLFKESTQGPPEEVLEEFFAMLSRAGGIMTQSAPAARYLRRPPTNHPRAFSFYLQALAAIQAFQHGVQQPEPAFAFLLRAIRRDPQFTLACESLELLIHQCLNKGGRPAQAAQRALERTQMRAADGYPRFHALLGLQLLQSGESQRGRPLLERYLEEETSGSMPSRVMMALAGLYREEDDREHVQGLLRRAVEANPENAAAWEELGDTHQEAGERTRAEECWRRALEENPDRPGSLWSLARAHHQRGDFQRARTLLDRLLQLGVRDADTLFLWIDTMIALNALEDAEEEAMEWVEADGQNPRAWLAIGRVRRRMGDFRAARHSAARIQEFSEDPPALEEAELLEFGCDQPSEYQRFDELRREYTQAGDGLTDASWETLKSLGERHPCILALRRLIAVAGARRGCDSDVLMARRALARAYPDRSEGWEELGRLQLRLKRYSDAVDSLRRACQLDPARAPLHLVLSRAEIHGGHVRDALDSLRVAASLEPQNETIRRAVSKLEERLEENPALAAPAEPPSGEISSPDSGILRLLRRFFRR